MAGRLERGDVRLCSFPAPDKTRPVVVLTRSSAIPYLARVTVAPITCSIRAMPSEVVIGPDDGMKIRCAVSLHNLATVRKEILGRRVASLGDHRMREICSSLAFALGCDD